MAARNRSLRQTSAPSARRRRFANAAIIGLLAGICYVALIRQTPSDESAGVGEGWNGSGVEGAEDISPPTPRFIALPQEPQDGQEPGPKPASLGAPIEPKSSPRAWAIPASLLEPRAARLEGGELVQHLADGTRLHLTLDPLLQRAAQESLEKYQVGYGVVVAIRPATGEILAWAEHAEGRPELRRLALVAEGPAASLFKLVTTAALLEYGNLSPQTSICTHGGLRKLVRANLRPNPRRDRKCQTLGQALGASNNVAFARWADQMLKPAQLQAMAERFLFNRRIPFVWEPAVSRVRIPSNSRLGFARSAAGFEGSQLSPLHAAVIMAGLANGGRAMVPHLVRHAESEGQTLYRAEPTPLVRLLSPELAGQVLQMAVETTTSGTGKKFFEKRGRKRLGEILVAGKTGTLTANDTGVARHYSWFVAAAPADNPEIAIASLVVNGKTWTVKGIVPAREVLDAWYGRMKTQPAKKKHP